MRLTLEQALCGIRGGSGPEAVPDHSKYEADAQTKL